MVRKAEQSVGDLPTSRNQFAQIILFPSRVLWQGVSMVAVPMGAFGRDVYVTTRSRPGHLAQEYSAMFWGFREVLETFYVVILVITLFNVSIAILSTVLPVYFGQLVDQMTKVDPSTLVKVLTGLVIALLIEVVQKVLLELWRKLYNITQFQVRLIDRLWQLLRHAQAEGKSYIDPNDSVETIFRNGEQALYEFGLFVTREPAFFLKGVFLILYYLPSHPVLMLVSILLMGLDVVFAIYIDAKLEPLNKRKTDETKHFWKSFSRNAVRVGPAADAEYRHAYERYREAFVRRERLEAIFNELILNLVSLLTVYLIKIVLIVSVAMSDMTYGQFTAVVTLVLSTQSPSGIYMQLQKLIIMHRHNLREVGKACGVSFGHTAA